MNILPASALSLSPPADHTTEITKAYQDCSIDDVERLLDGEAIPTQEYGPLILPSHAAEDFMAIGFLNSFTSSNTRRTYIMVLRRLFGLGFLHLDFTQLTAKEVNKIMRRVTTESRLSTRTKRLYLSVIKGILRFGYTHDFDINDREYTKIQDIKVTDKLGNSNYHALNDAEMASIYQAIDAQPNPIKVARDRALISIMQMAGLRCNEVVTLQLSDVDFVGRSINIIGKGNKKRSLPLHDKLIKNLRPWLAYRHPDKHHDNEPFFQALTRKKATPRPMSKSSVFDTVTYPGKTNTQVVNLRKLGSHKDYHETAPHQYRRTFATNSFKQGVSIDVISGWLGHSNKQTTETYILLALKNEVSREAMRNLTFQD